MATRGRSGTSLGVCCGCSVSSCRLCTACGMLISVRWRPMNPRMGGSTHGSDGRPCGTWLTRSCAMRPPADMSITELCLVPRAAEHPPHPSVSSARLIDMPAAHPFLDSYIESGPDREAVRPWVWIAALLLGSMTVSLAMQFYHYVSVRCRPLPVGDATSYRVLCRLTDYRRDAHASCPNAAHVRPLSADAREVLQAEVCRETQAARGRVDREAHCWRV